jgi:hypothetical protein
MITPNTPDQAAIRTRVRMEHKTFIGPPSRQRRLVPVAAVVLGSTGSTRPPLMVIMTNTVRPSKGIAATPSGQ